MLYMKNKIKKLKITHIFCNNIYFSRLSLYIFLNIRSVSSEIKEENAYISLKKNIGSDKINIITKIYE